MDMEITYLTEEEIIQINKDVVSESAVETDTFGLLKEKDLNFLVERIRGMKNIWDAAAKLLTGLIEGHIFLEGNKRTALSALETFLKLNGYNFSIEINEIKVLYDIAEQKMNFKEIREWIKEHSVKEHG
ncbi:MAG: type II toxin-antitoxin system death-on-curing family toxin [Candidatus Aenigmatarchaeota archaeon]